MNTFEIEKTVERDKCLAKGFLGVFPSDHLPTISERPVCFIANTDPSNKPGQHWVAMFFDKYAEYFDSYGLEPRFPFSLYKVDIVNGYCLQSVNSVVCGEYCIYYLHKRIRGTDPIRIVSDLKSRTNSDQYVKNYINKLKVNGCIGDCQSCTSRAKQK